MADRQYKFNITRNGVDSEFYIHDDNTLEFTIPENNAPVEYLDQRLNIVKALVAVAREYQITKFKLTPP